MTMKSLLYLIFFISFVSTIFSQNEAFQQITGEDRALLEQEIVAASQAMNTLQCDFVQEKSSKLFADKAVSKGILSYQKPETLRWEYTEPSKFALILNEDRVYLANESGAVENSNKMFKYLAALIVGTVNGEGFLDAKTFQVCYYQSEEAENLILVKMTPVQKRLKEVYASIEIKIDKKDFLASEIVMREATGDVMTISLLNKKVNAELPQTLFLAN